MATTASFTSSGSWVCPDGVTSVSAECWGQGGQGFGPQPGDPWGVGGGGGAGSYAKKALTVTPAVSYTVHIDSASTYFVNATTVKALAGASAVDISGAAGGATGIGDTTTAGPAGSNGVQATNGGNGGSSPNGGAGGAGATTAGNSGADGAAPGGGGGGGWGAGPLANSNGGSGKVLLTYTVTIPTVNGPLYNGDTVVGGSGTAGYTAQVYVGGVLKASVVVPTSGLWSVTLGTALATGNSVTANQVSPGGITSTTSAAVTVQAVVSAADAPVILGPLYSGQLGIIGSGRVGATITLYKNGTNVGTATVAADTSWRVTLGTAYASGDVFKATQAYTGLTSAYSATETVVAAPTNTDSWVTTIKGHLDAYSITHTAADDDDIRKLVGATLTDASIASGSAVQIAQSMLFVMLTKALQILGRSS